MRHHNTVRKLGRETVQRRALLRSLAESLLSRGKIVTTEAKAKELRPFVEKLITRGKSEALDSRRLLLSKLGNRTVVKKMVEEISKKYKDRKGGYTRIIKQSPRLGDGSKMALIELV